jgi:ribosomal protein S18 acetylase RimI-like enzyme
MRNSQNAVHAADTSPRQTEALTWRLRPALPGDAPALRDGCMPGRTLERVDGLLRRGQKAALHRRGLGLVVELSDGRLVGFGQLTLWPSTAEISDVIVAEAWRGQGIGSALIRRLLRAAHEMAMDRAEIGVALRNDRALRLYRRLGFEYGRTIDLDLGSGPEPVMYMEMDLADLPAD